MNNETTIGEGMSSEEPEAVATGFTAHEYTPDEIAKIRWTRHRTPRTGEVAGRNAVRMTVSRFNGRR